MFTIYSQTYCPGQENSIVQITKWWSNSNLKCMYDSHHLSSTFLIRSFHFVSYICKRHITQDPTKRKRQSKSVTAKHAFSKRCAPFAVKQILYFCAKGKSATALWVIECICWAAGRWAKWRIGFGIISWSLSPEVCVSGILDWIDVRHGHHKTEIFFCCSLIQWFGGWSPLKMGLQ